MPSSVARSIILLAMVVALNLSGGSKPDAAASEAEIVSTQKIWDKAPHNAFTDLIHYKGEWFCVFREGEKHVSPDGALRVLVSKDGEKWESAALITSEDCDLRDAKINVTPDGQLMLCGAGYMDKYDQQKKAKQEITTHSHESYSWFSDDGRNWSERKLIGDKNNWLWRVTWHKGKAYGVGYNTSPQMPKGTNLYRSNDGKNFERFVPEFTGPDKGYTNETSIIFTPDDTAYCLLRRDGKESNGLWGTAHPPYDKWTWQDMGLKLGGPHMLQLPDGRIVAAVRLYDKPVRTSLCWIEPETGKITEFQKLPSGGDTSYAGLVYHDDLLWVSYYSSHEGKTNIYLSKVKIDLKEQAQKKTRERPNIVFLFSDDHAPWAVGAAGDPHAVTPNMDRIYREGAVFPNSFTITPVCSPSRAELMTSRYGTELKITDWINPRKEPTHGLDPKYPVWPKLLAEAGYKTGLVGKWHLGTEDRFHPTVFGYQHFMGFRSGGNRPVDPTLEVEGKETKLKGLLPDILTDNAIEFINQNAGEPFLLSLHFRAPHAPWLPVADEDWSPYENLDPKIPNPDYPHLDTKRVKQKTREYLASISSVDRNIGRVLEELDRLNLTENTVVIYSSDHGYNMGHNGIWHKGNGHWILTKLPPGTQNVPAKQRPNMYDHSIRVPTAIRYPKLLKPGTVIDETVTNMDWFPTLLELAGVDLPAETKIHGRSFVPLMKNKSQNWNNDLYCEYSTQHQSKTHMRMYRTEEWKLIRDFLNPERHELYDLQNDPAETTNLINSDDPAVKQVIADLHQKIIAQMKAINDPVLATVAH